MFHGTCQPISGPDYDHVEAASSGIGQHTIERRPFRSCTAHAVINIFLDDLEPALLDRGNLVFTPYYEEMKNKLPGGLKPHVNRISGLRLGDGLIIRDKV
jgi:hypothetical protein